MYFTFLEGYIVKTSYLYLLRADNMLQSQYCSQFVIVSLSCSRYCNQRQTRCVLIRRALQYEYLHSYDMPHSVRDR